MESVVAALATGVLTLAGVLVFNSRSCAVMELKLDNLTRWVERHNCLVKRLRPEVTHWDRSNRDQTQHASRPPDEASSQTAHQCVSPAESGYRRCSAPFRSAEMR